MKNDMESQIEPPTLTKLEYFALIIGANLDGYPSTWADRAIERAQKLIAELDKMQGVSHE